MSPRSETPDPWREAMETAGTYSLRNGFGANIRTQWVCTVDRDEAAETWTLVSLDI